MQDHIFINEHLEAYGKLYNLFVRTHILIVLSADMMNFCKINSYSLVDRFIYEYFSVEQPDSIFYGFILYLTEYGTKIFYKIRWQFSPLF
jgi:hypothetical protein